ncbi:hypothetical protein HML84_08195 [Alcanivorax sp. IO_7]|nr:hypothetical protein HML84_08195 [Alcanivorax sp. IO_7]
MGVDLSASAVGMTLNKGCKAMKLDPGKTLHEQVKGDWDVVIMMEIIEHIPNAEDFVREVVDLDPEILFITIPNVGYILHRIRLALCGRFPVTSIFYHMREHLRFWTVKDFIDWAPTVNLRVEKYYAQCDKAAGSYLFGCELCPLYLPVN